MTELDRFAKHANEMAGARHQPACPPADRLGTYWTVDYDDGGDNKPTPDQPPACLGCVTDAERAEWRLLADVANRMIVYLRNPPTDPEEPLL